MYAPSLRGVFALCLSIGALTLACGRSDLDITDPNTVNVTTGGGGGATVNGGATGHGGATGFGGVTGTGGAIAHGGTTGTGVPTGGVTGFGGFFGTGGTVPVGGATGQGGATMVPPPPPPPPPPIPCGTMTCDNGTQKCCVSPNGTVACLALDEMCGGGISIACATSATCGANDVCCASASNGIATSCERPAACLRTGGFILCTGDAECPNALPNCCGIEGLRICRARACGGGPGTGAPGGGGPGGGNRGGGAPPPPPAN